MTRLIKALAATGFFVWSIIAVAIPWSCPGGGFIDSCGAVDFTIMVSWMGVFVIFIFAFIYRALKDFE